MTIINSSRMGYENEKSLTRSVELLLLLSVQVGSIV